MFDALAKVAETRAHALASQEFADEHRATWSERLRIQLECENLAALETATQAGDNLAIPALIGELATTIARIPGKERIALTTRRHLWTPYVQKMESYRAGLQGNPGSDHVEVRAADLWTVRSNHKRKMFPDLAILIYERRGNYASEPLQLAVSPLKIQVPDSRQRSRRVNIGKLFLKESALAQTFLSVDLESSFKGKSAKELAVVETKLGHFIHQVFSPRDFWDEYLSGRIDEKGTTPRYVGSRDFHEVVINRYRKRIRNELLPRIQKEGIDPGELQPGIHQSAKNLRVINKLLEPGSVETVNGWLWHKKVTKKSASAIAVHAVDTSAHLSSGIFETQMHRQALAEQIERCLLGQR